MKLKKAINLIGITAFIVLAKINIFAGNLQKDKAYTGTVKLLQDATKATGVLGGLISVICGLYFIVRKNMADEQDQKMWDKRIKISIVCAIGIVAGAGILNSILGYYK